MIIYDDSSDYLIIHEASRFVQRKEAKSLKQFDIELHSFDEVQDFVEVATIQPFRVVVGNSRTLVNAKSFMGMFSLNFREPVHVRADCTDEECALFKQAAARFLA